MLPQEARSCVRLIRQISPGRGPEGIPQPYVWPFKVFVDISPRSSFCYSCEGIIHESSLSKERKSASPC